MSHQTALEQHLRLKSPQAWPDLVKTVNTYLNTMYTSSEATPMEIGAVTMQGHQQLCACCGKTGHVKADCRFKDAECRTCCKTGHLSNVCRSDSKGPSKGSGKMKGKDKGNDKACLCCGRKGHVKSNCKFKDEKRSICGKVGHLKAVCRAKAAHQVENKLGEEQEASADMVWAMMISQTDFRNSSENGSLASV